MKRARRRVTLRRRRRDDTNEPVPRSRFSFLFFSFSSVVPFGFRRFVGRRLMRSQRTINDFIVAVVITVIVIVVVGVRRQKGGGLVASRAG